MSPADTCSCMPLAEQQPWNTLQLLGLFILVGFIVWCLTRPDTIDMRP